MPVVRRGEGRRRRGVAEAEGGRIRRGVRVRGKGDAGGRGEP